MYNIVNNCKEEKSNKKIFAKKLCEAKCIRILMLKYFRSPLAIKK